MDYDFNDLLPIVGVSTGRLSLDKTLIEARGTTQPRAPVEKSQWIYLWAFLFQTIQHAIQKVCASKKS